MPTRSPSRRTGAPSASSARSVWSRVAAGSTTNVSPDACTPARSRAPFTCAEGASMRCSIPSSRPPVTMSGGWPSVVRTVAPICRSGPATRSIGRVLRLRSPVSLDVNGAVARIPASSRIEVPELPQSRPAPGSTSPSRPSPSTSSVPFETPRGVSFHVEPPPSTPDEALRAHRSRAGRAFSVSSARHDAVDRTSRAPGRPVKRLRLEPVHARISQRWAMDLSPGT